MTRLSQAQVSTLRALSGGPIMRPLKGKSWVSYHPLESRVFRPVTLRALKRLGLLYFGSTRHGSRVARITELGTRVMRAIDLGEDYEAELGDRK